MEKEINKLFYGDNLDILRRYVSSESIDLIYLDPPFKSEKAYNIFFEEKNGGKSKAQIKVFEDTWHWDRTAEETYTEIIEKAPKEIKEAIIAFRNFLDETDMMAYLVMMTIRIIELHRVLKPTGSIYLHCDMTASHYLKIIMDRIFDIKNFRNEIVWCYSSPSGAKQDFPRKHDIILRYSKGEKPTFNPDAVRIPYSQSFLDRRKYIEGEGGIYAGKERDVEMSQEEYKKGKIPEDWWIDIPSGGQVSIKERMGYPTQKPEKLLERIIKASSNEGNVVLDPFCGCGTAVVVAQKLNRKWIGIDITHLAINLIKNRLKDMFGDGVKYDVIGEPITTKEAEELAKEDRYQFQWWALGLVGARPNESEQKKGKDTGVDGVLYFFDEPKNAKKIIIQVKSGHVGVRDIREICNVVDTQRAQIGVFITLEQPTREMKKEAVKVGYYNSVGWGKKYPKVQILTIDELLNGKKIEYPPKTNITFKKANKVEKIENNQQLSL